MEPGVSQDLSDRQEHQPALRKSQMQFRKTEFKVHYMNEDDPRLEEQLKLVYQLSCKTLRYRNKGFWVKCCNTVVRNTEAFILGHPADQAIKLKDFFDGNFLTSEAAFVKFMKETLPTNDQGQLLFPTINMFHSSDRQVKVEHKVEEDGCLGKHGIDLELLEAEVNKIKLVTTELSAIKTDLEAGKAHFTRLTAKVGSLTTENDLLRRTVKVQAKEIDSLTKQVDDLEFKNAKLFERMAELENMSRVVYRKNSQLDFKVQLLLDEAVQRKPSLGRAIKLAQEIQGNKPPS